MVVAVAPEFADKGDVGVEVPAVEEQGESWGWVDHADAGPRNGGAAAAAGGNCLADGGAGGIGVGVGLGVTVVVVVVDVAVKGRASGALGSAAKVFRVEVGYAIDVETKEGYEEDGAEGKADWNRGD